MKANKKAKIDSEKTFFKTIKPLEGNVFHKKSIKAARNYAKWSNKKQKA